MSQSTEKQVIEISTSDIVYNNNESLSTDYSDNIIEDFKTITVHNQKVIKCQQLKLQHVHQEIEYEDNQRELRELNLHLKEDS